MGTNIHPTAIQFFEDRMRQHNLVASFELLSNRDNYLYRIKRIERPPVIVHYSDAYRYGEIDFETRPTMVGSNSFVLLLPHADQEVGVFELAQRSRIAIGKIGRLMGALQEREMWKYKTPEERDEEESQKNH